MQIATNRLKGRTALITGCGSETGNGFATANLLSSRATRVAITSTTNRINRRQAAIDPSGQRVRACVAELIAFLASDEATCITGQMVVIDGGNTILEYKGPRKYY